MARIYYRERKIVGNELNSSVVTYKKIHFIFEYDHQTDFEFENKFMKGLFGFLKKSKEVFRVVSVVRDDIFYNDGTYGKFYLPNAIIFCDEEDFNFPTKFYFLTQIDNQLELRQCAGGEDIKYYIPNLHTECTDKDIIQKVENTIEKIYTLVKNTPITKPEQEEIKVEKEKLPIDKLEKEAYQELCKLCITNKQKRKEICDFFEILKNYENDEEYYTTLNFVMEFLETNDYNFIMRMDWKSDVEDLEWLINGVLEANYGGLNVDLPQYDKDDDDLTVSSNNVFESFSNSLKKYNIQLGFIDTKSDEYISIIHKIEDKDKIKSLVNKVGYEYFEK